MFRTHAAAIAVVVATVLFTAASPPAQSPAAPSRSGSRARSNALAQSLPDWSGVWMMVGPTVFDTATQTGRGVVTTPGVREHPPYNAEWEAVYRTHLELRDKNRFPDTISTCGVPAGFPRLFNLPDAYEFIIRPEQVWVLTENGPNILRVYTDGRPHLEDQWDTYTGDSVGRWEGDTLVFTTRALKGFRDKDVILDRTGLVLSDKARVTTRIRRPAPDTLDVRMTIEDPVTLTKPWPVTKQFRKQPAGTRVYDYGCAENNRNPVDPTTGKTLILGPDGAVLNK